MNLSTPKFVYPKLVFNVKNVVLPNMKQLWQLTRHFNSFEIGRNLLPSSRGNLDELRFLPTEVLHRSVFDCLLLVLAPFQFFCFLWCLSSTLLVEVMWRDCRGFPDNGVADNGDWRVPNRNLPYSASIFCLSPLLHYFDQKSLILSFLWSLWPCCPKCPPLVDSNWKTLIFFNKQILCSWYMAFESHISTTTLQQHFNRFPTKHLPTPLLNLLWWPYPPPSRKTLTCSWKVGFASPVTTCAKKY